jgi:hypothetical protein
MTSDFGEAIRSTNRRAQLEALRDFLVHELEVARCNTCLASKLRTGDTAALVLRLQKVLEEIEALPREDGVVSDLDRIRAKRASRTPASQDSAPPSKRGFSGS